MAFGIESWVDTHPVVNSARVTNHIYTLKITNQKAGSYEYTIPNANGEGDLIWTHGKMTNDVTTVGQGGDGKAQIKSLSIAGTKLSITMMNIPDPNTVSEPLHLNFFLRRN